MKSLKKALLFMMSVLVLTLLKPTAGLAATVVSSITLTDATGVQTQIIPEDGDVSGTGWSYTAASNTLTLSGWSGQNISANGDINLVLSGTNTITLADEKNSKAIEGTTFCVSGSSDSDKLLIQGNLTKSFYGIYASLDLGDNAHIKIDITSTSTENCSGYFSGYVTFVGSNSSIDVDVTAGGEVQALSNINAVNSGSSYCGEGNTVNASAKSTGPYKTTAIGGLYVSKANPVITASATNDGTKPDYCFGVNGFTGLLFTEGGKLDVTGLVCAPLGNCNMNDFSRNIVTTTPANNAYYWDIIDLRYYKKNVLFSLDGTVCYHTVFEYSATPADTVWYGDERFTLPGGKVGDSLKDYGYSFYLTDYLRGLDSYSSDATFTIKSGSLPEGIKLAYYYGSVTGTFSKVCPAGSVVITVTNQITKNSIDFTLNYGAVAEADKNITIGGVNYNTKTNASGTGWSYTAADTTLTLNNYSGGKISTEIALNLMIKGTNVITLSNEAGTTGLEGKSPNGKFTVSGEKASDKLTIQGDLTEQFYGIGSKVDLKDNAHLVLNIKSTTTKKSYGINNDLSFTGADSSVDVTITSAGVVEGLNGLDARNYSTSYCGSGNVANVTAKSTGASEVVGIGSIYIYKANPAITVSATNDGSKPDYCEGVNFINDMLFTAGGKLDITGMACTNEAHIPDNLNRNIVTTTPANNAYYWDLHTGARKRNVLYNTDGTICYHTVFEYSSTPADLAWYGDDFTLPGGKVGDTLYDGGNSFYLTDYVRGLDGYHADSTFTIKSGNLPEGITLNQYYGSLSGSFTKRCDAGSVEITVTNDKSKNSLDFTLNYGAVTSAKPVTGLSLSASNLTVGMNCNKTFNATITPADASDKSISVSSSDENIARATPGKDNEDGSKKIYVYGLRVGTVTITVTSLDTNIKQYVTVSVKDSVPNAKIDYRGEQFTDLVANADYIITVGETSEDKTASTSGTIDIAEAYMGNTVSIVKKGAVASENSDPQEIAVPARPAAPVNCSFAKPSNKTTPDGTLILGASYREYKLESATEWKKAYTSTEIPYVGIGTYKVRDAADETRFTGLAATVTIVAEDLAFKNTTGLEIPAGTVHIPITDIELYNYVGGGKPSYTFTKVSGPDWISVSAGGNISGSPTAVATAATLTVKVTDEDSEEKTLEIPVGAVSACEHTGGTATCTEYAKCSLCNQPYGALLAHDYAPATCTAPKTCKNCPATDGDPLDHDWKAATCTAPKTCRRDGCGETEGSPLDHDWKAATCTAPKTCQRDGCGATEGNPLDHDWKAATCTDPKTCKREGCGAIDGQALGHNWKAATCTEPKKCDREGCTETEGDPLGHDYEDATCIAPATCKKCNTTMGEIVPEAHNVVTDPAVAATCTKEGKTEGKHCSLCNKVFVAQKTVAKKAHTKTGKVTPATVKKDGSIKYYCKVCNTSLGNTVIKKAVVTCDEQLLYTGKALTPVKISGDKDIKSHYKIVYKNNKKVGKATATITFKGNYKGTVTVNFTIVKKDMVPSKVSSLKVTAASKSLNVSWKQGSKVTDGYQIQYSTDKKFLSGVKSVTIKKAATTSYTIKSLKSKTNYYVRIRAYNKEGSVTAYSAWATFKTAVKTK